MRSCQLTYNHQNWVGAGCKDRDNGGLTEFGVEMVDEYFKHLQHAIKVVGVEHVCIGSDREHRVIKDTPEEMALLHAEEGPNFVNNDWPLYMTSLNGPRRMEAVWDGLKKMGCSDTDTEKIMGQNLYHLYKDVIG